jgi:hypothetical protein
MWVFIVFFLACVIGFVDAMWKIWDEPESWTSLRKLAHTKIGSKLSSSHVYAENKTHGMDVFVSMTTIKLRLSSAVRTIETVLKGTVLPTEIFLFVSREAFMLDTGITQEDILSPGLGLINLMYQYNYPFIRVVFTDNIGPHRKLLPLLWNKWDDDIAIITIDDDYTYQKQWMEYMLKYFDATNRSAVVAPRARRVALCTPRKNAWKMLDYATRDQHTQWPLSYHSHMEMMLLPTGVAGILYRPFFFKRKLFTDYNLLNVTKTTDDLMFRLITLANRVPVVTACIPGEPTSEDSKTSTFWETLGLSQRMVCTTTPEIKTSRLVLESSRVVYERSYRIMNQRNKVSSSGRQLRYDNKEPSLMTNFNKKGNSGRWFAGVEVLKKHHGVDIQKIVEIFALADRRDCMKYAWMEKRGAMGTCGILPCKKV